MMRKASLLLSAAAPKWLLPALLVLALLLLAACGGPSGDDGQSAGPAGQNGAGTDPAHETGSDPTASDGDWPDYGWLMGDPVHPWNTDVQIGRARVAVLDVTADAWPELAGTDVVPPKDDHQYVLIRLRINNASDETINTPMNFSIGYSDKNGNFFQRGEMLLDDPCWNVPGGLWDEGNTELDPGATREINVCVEVPDESVSGGVVDVSWMVLGEMAGAFFRGVR